MKILLVDDHDLFRAGLKSLLKELDSSLETDEAGSCAEAVQRVRTGAFQLVLLDLKMPGTQGLEGVKAVVEAAGRTPVVVLSGEQDAAVVQDTIDEGAAGFIPKTAKPTEVIEIMRVVLSGRVYLPAPILDRVPLNEALGLTERQMEVLQRLIKGKPNKVIGRELEVSEATVKAHLTAVFNALGVKNRTAAVYVAAKLGVPVN